MSDDNDDNDSNGTPEIEVTAEANSGRIYVSAKGSEEDSIADVSKVVEERVEHALESTSELHDDPPGAGVQ